MTSAFRDTLDQVFNFEGFLLPAPPPKGRNTADALERRYGIILPEDFRTYLTLAAPRQSDMHPYSMVIFRGLDRLCSLRDQLAGNATPYDLPVEIAAQSDQYIVFGEYIDWDHGYAICCVKGENYGKVALIGSPVIPDGFIASDLADFLKQVNENTTGMHEAALSSKQ